MQAETLMADGSAQLRQASVRSRWTWAIRDSDLPATTRLVAWALATFMRADGECWPSVPTIAAAAGSNESTVKRHLRLLDERGWIERTRGGGSGRGSRERTTRYVAALPAQSAPLNGSKGVQRIALRGAEEPSMGGTVHPEVSKEVPKEGSAPHEPGGSAPPNIAEDWIGDEWEGWREHVRRGTSSPAGSPS
jgi:hypothetical protein